MQYFFYWFTSIGLSSVICSIITSNSVYGVLFLIFAFLNAGFIILLLNAELLAILFILVYVGATLILLLFVVMLLDIQIGQKYKWTSLILNATFLICFCICFLISFNLIFLSNSSWHYLSSINWFQSISQHLNLEVLGILYTKFAFIPLLLSLILLIAIIGSILLSHAPVIEGKKYQKFNKQTYISPNESIFYHQ